MLFINLYVHLESVSRKTKNFYIGYTTTTLSRRLTYHISIKQLLIIKHNNNINQIISCKDVKKILTDNTIILFTNNKKKRLQILEKNMHKK